MTEKQRFKPGPFRRIVKETAAELGIRNTSLQVLYVLLDAINYQTGHARTARETLMRKLGRSEKAVKNALKELRGTGIIEPVAYPKGGRGRSPVYQFRYTAEAVRRYNESCKTGAEFSPLSTGGFLENRGKNFPKQGQNFPETGENSAPPSTESSNIYRNAAAPSRREVDKFPDPDRGGELTTFGELATRHGFGRAFEIKKAAQAETET